MDLDFTESEDAFRMEVRAWMRANVPAPHLPSLETEEGFALHREWEGMLHEARLSAVSWPEQYGGRNASALEWIVFEEEYYAAGGPGRVNQSGVNLLAPTLFTHGTREQRDRVLPAMASGREIWAQAWSEPGAGSDLAGIRSTATRTDGGWLLHGQKIWSSRAPFADRAFGIFRSGGARHSGLIYVMFGLDTAGPTVRPIRRLDGKPAFAELFFDGVFVPDADVIGEPGDGWRVAMSTAGSERGLTLRSPGRFTAAADRLVDLWRERADPGDTALRNRVADAWIRARAYRMHGYAALSRMDDPGAEASMVKVFWSELDVAMAETALDLLGADAELEGVLMEDYVFALAGPIYAGTNEIQRNVVAERVLGLPKSTAKEGSTAKARRAASASTATGGRG